MTNKTIKKDDGTGSKVEEGGAISFTDGKPQPDSIDSVAQTSAGVTSPQSNSRYKTGLEFVSDAAIGRYVGEVAIKFQIPPELGVFAAYFCNAEYQRTLCRLNLTEPATMRGPDFLESVRMLFGNDNLSDASLKLLVENENPNVLLTEDFRKIDVKLFPEYTAFKKSKDNYTKSTNALLELIKLPPRGRTFYAGVIDYAIINKGFKIKDDTPESHEPMLGVSSRLIIEYASNNNFQDYTRYMKMIKGG